MTKQKSLTTKNRPPISKRRAQTPSRLHNALFHRKRLIWFMVVVIGLLIIQFTYNARSGSAPQILGYATSISPDRLLQDTNDARAQLGLPPLLLNDKLSRGAQAKADDMINGNYWSHVAPDGTLPWSYFQKVNYNYSSAGENLAYGFHSSDEIVTAWMNSQEHKDNILGGYRDVGFGLASGQTYQQGANTVIVAFYGLPSDRPALASTASQNTQLPINAQHINGLSSIMSGGAPWASYASLALIGAAVMGFLVTHMETLRLGWRNARRYAVVHPAIDAAVLLGIALIVVQAAGGFIR